MMNRYLSFRISFIISLGVLLLTSAWQSPTLPSVVTTSTPLTIVQSISPAQTTCELDTYRDVTIRDGTVMAPGEVFLKIWRMENISPCILNSDEYFILFEIGEQMSGPEFSPLLTYAPRTKLSLEPDDPDWKSRVYIIEQGDMVDIPLVLQAPQEPGKYRGYWKIIHGETGEVLEDDFWVEIRVKEPDDDDWLPGLWSGEWTNLDPSTTEPRTTPLSLYQAEEQVTGFTYSFDGRLYLIAGQALEDGRSVEGLMAQIGTDGHDFRWELLEDDNQFQGVFWIGQFAAGSWCGGRDGESLPEPCELR